MHTLALHYYKQSNTVYHIYSYYYESNKSLSWHIIKSFSESDLLLELEFELINSTSGSNLWHWNTLARHLNFSVPSQVRAPLLDLSYSPYYPEVQAACSGATAAPGAGTLSAMHPSLVPRPSYHCVPYLSPSAQRERKRAWVRGYNAPHLAM